ncbi:transketolase family protein [Diplocloster modestus]|uniref:Transketolase family protein n=1 Tax=Diplocloster modestus TaxID=2850322 RepID=A0ABS6KF14_9FIRM|nr:transketolase C-terminal domain-containing protein [Diplocloster modestus]MBU9729126.1 transketolase family protein [Diplocloster modestus]
MNKIPNRQAICDVLIEKAKTDKDIVVLCSDSRGSSSMTPFAQEFPEQFVEVGIAEQNLVGIAAGLAKCGKKPFAASPASFLSTRSYEQVKVDCAYSNTNVKLIGVSGGVSYGALGMSHHSAQDIAAMSSVPNMRVYLPSDRFQTAKLIKALLEDDKPAYIRVGRNPVEDIYSEEFCPFELNKANLLAKGEDAAVIACGEMVRPAVDAAKMLEAEGIYITVLDMYCLKPLDREAVLEAAARTKLLVTMEEHSPFGGLGAMVSQLIGSRAPRKVINMALPDAPVITGTSGEVFEHYGLNANGLVIVIKENL